MSLYKVLENPSIHNFCQKLLAIGRNKAVKLTEQFLIKNCHGKILDIGCGTGRYVHLFQRDYFGADINLNYLKGRVQKGRYFICCDSKILPFKNHVFDTIFCVGFFHHIEFQMTKIILEEIIRVAKVNARVLIVDFHYPNRKLDLLGWLVSKLDRGRHVRSQDIFINELQGYFDILNFYYIDYSYPYNLNAYVLKIR